MSLVYVIWQCYISRHKFIMAFWYHWNKLNSWPFFTSNESCLCNLTVLYFPIQVYYGILISLRQNKFRAVFFTTNMLCLCNLTVLYFLTQVYYGILISLRRLHQPYFLMKITILSHFWLKIYSLKCYIKIRRSELLLLKSGYI